MKKIFSCFYLLISVYSFALDEYNIKLVSQSNNSLIVDFNLTNYQFVNINISSNSFYTKIAILGGVPTLVKGDPELLKFTSNIQLPAKGISTFSVLESSYIEIEGINIAPSKGNLYRNIDPSSVPYSEGVIYNIDDDFPKEQVSMGIPYIHRDVRGQTINFTPFAFNPVKKTLKVYNKIRIKINFETKLVGQNELISPKNRSISSEVNKIYKKRYLNYHTPRYNSLGQEGSMLIISPSEYFSEIQKLIDWKMKSGIEVELVDIATIGNSQTNIYNYVRNYYNQHPDFLYLLLVGDHNKVASYNAGSTGGWMSEIKWSDSKYGLVSNSNDWYPDIYVGRFSPSNLNDLENMIQRNLEYEINPIISDYYQFAIGLGSNEGAGYGDDGEADWQHLRNIRTDLLNFGYQHVYEFYDGSHGGEDANGNPNYSIISSAVNNGVSLFNYTGHGDINTCITGNYSSSHINSATNNGKYPFVVSVACNNGTFTSGTCISEVWQRASNAGSPSGAIAAAGSSILMSWAPPMATQDEIVDILVESYSDNQMHTIGALFYSGQMKMLDDYPNSGKEVIETWVLFCDPTTLFRSKTPNSMNVSHIDEVEVGINSLNVTCDEEDAKVTLWNGDSLIGISKIYNGQVDFTFDTLNEIDTLDIVISAYNKLPYFGTLRTTDPIPNPLGKPDDLLFGPNPLESDFQLNLIFELNNDQTVNFEIFNPLGQKVFRQENDLTAGFYGPNYTPMILNLSKLNLKTGIYQLSTNINETILVKQLFVP